MTLLDLMEGERRKEEGLKEAALSKADLLDVAQTIAKELARGPLTLSISTDDVRQEMIERGYPTSLGPAWGAVFRTSDWEHVGYRASCYTSNHGRVIKTWRLK